MANKCVICGSSPWSYYSDFRNNIVCSHHNNIQYCAGCGGFIPNISLAKKINKDNLLCEHCQRNHVDSSNLHKFTKLTYDILYHRGFQDIQPDWIIVKLISRDAMDKEVQSLTALGYHTEITRSNLSIRGRSDFNQLVCILNYLMPINFMQVFAHEILHAWQLQNNLNDYTDYDSDIVAKRACEGFANLGSYIIYDYFDSDKFNDDIRSFAQTGKRSLMSSEDDIYGIPFQKIMAAYPINEKGRWLRLIRDARLGKIKDYVR